VKRDIFSRANKITHLAHCVSGCVTQGKGFASVLCSMFPENKFPKGTQFYVGQIIAVKTIKFTILNIITKKRAADKPTEEDFKLCIKNLKLYAVKNCIKSIAMPKIGCGLDKLKFDFVTSTLISTFDGCDISLTMYML
jgi:hypothetical protein